ncbi:hypothetical protein MASR2M48_18870 [Spirochaetota bacterium]
MRASGLAKPFAAALALALLSLAAWHGYGQSFEPSGPLPGVVAAPVEAETLFRFPVGGVVSSGPTIRAGRAWLLSDSKVLYVLTIDGVAIGRRELSERRSAFLVADDYGRAAVSSGLTGMAIINKAGQEVWRVDLGVAPSSVPVFSSDGRLFVTAAGALVAFAPNGRRLWRNALEAEPSAPLVIGPGGGPAIALQDGTLVLYSPDGMLLGTTKLEASALALASSPRDICVALADGRLAIVKLDSSGSLKAAVSIGRGLGAKPIGLAWSTDGFYALGSDGTLVAIGINYEESWRVATRLGAGPAALAAFDGRVITLTKTAVHSYGADGSPYRTLGLSNTVSLPAIAPNGSVFAGGADWILYAYRFERGLVSGSAPSVPPLDLEAIDAVAKEEAMWSIAPYDDSIVMENLYDIEKSVKSGTIEGGVRSSLSYAAAVALGRMDSPFGSGTATTGPSPRGALPRVYACGLLGGIGLPQAVSVLVDVFKNDPEPAVRAAAALAVAQIGLDPEGGALEAFAKASERGLDARTASAIVDAIDGLYRASGALDERSGMLALIRIAGGEYPRDIKAKAQKVLARISTAR